jgi:hypothetical protein
VSESEFGALGDAAEAATLLEVVAAEGVVRGITPQLVLDWLQDVRTVCEMRRAARLPH